MKKLKINITEFPYAKERQRKISGWREVFEYWMTNIPSEPADKYLFCHMLWIRQIGYKALENKRIKAPILARGRAQKSQRAR